MLSLPPSARICSRLTLPCWRAARCAMEISLSMPKRSPRAPLSPPSPQSFDKLATRMAVETRDITDEQKAICEMVRQFADEQIIPNAEHYDHEDEFPDPI